MSAAAVCPGFSCISRAELAVMIEVIWYSPIEIFTSAISPLIRTRIYLMLRYGFDFACRMATRMDSAVHSFNSPPLMAPPFVQTDGVRQVSPGIVEVTGVPAGRYNVRLWGGAEPAMQMNGVDLTKDGEEIDTASAEALTTVKPLSRFQVSRPFQSGSAMVYVRDTQS